MKILVADYYHHHILSHKVDEIVLSILGPNFKAPSNRGTPSSRGQENLSEMKWDEKSDENSFDVEGGGGGSGETKEGDGSSVQSPMEVSLSSAVLVKNNQPSPLESTWIIESKRGKVVPDILNFYFVLMLDDEMTIISSINLFIHKTHCKTTTTHPHTDENRCHARGSDWKLPSSAPQTYLLTMPGVAVFASVVRSRSSTRVDTYQVETEVSGRHCGNCYFGALEKLDQVRPAWQLIDGISEYILVRESERRNVLL
jgi:hypothetical protein